MARLRGALWGALALASAVAIACGLRLMATDHEQAREYARLAATSPAAAGGEGAWEELDRTNPDVVAWLRVEGTSVDVPVCQASADDPDYYLYHDLWGDAVEVGNPYLDARCGPDAPEMTVYGHHTTLESYMFHDLSGCFAQEAFDGLGDATWAVPDGPAVALHPLCSTRLDRDDPTWQVFGNLTDAERVSWLASGCEAAGARSADWRRLCASASRVLVLVTCSGWQRFGWASRTVTVFVA